MDGVKFSKLEKVLLVLLFCSFFLAIIADFYHCGIQHTASEPAYQEAGAKTGDRNSEKLSGGVDDQTEFFHTFVSLSLFVIGCCSGAYLCKAYYTAKIAKVKSEQK